MFHVITIQSFHYVSRHYHVVIPQCFRSLWFSRFTMIHVIGSFSHFHFTMFHIIIMQSFHNFHIIMFQYFTMFHVNMYYYFKMFHICFTLLCFNHFTMFHVIMYYYFIVLHVILVFSHQDHAFVSGKHSFLMGSALNI